MTSELLSSETDASTSTDYDYQNLESGVHEETENPSESERTIWSVSTITVVMLGFIGLIEYSIVMPTLSEYVETLGGSSIFYGCCISAFSGARICFMPFVGYWSDKRRMIEPLVFTIFLALCGNFLYASAEWLGSPWFILIGRLLVGFGSASGTLSMSYVARVSTAENRTKTLTSVNGLNMVALILGPVTNLITKDVHWNTPIKGLSMNDLTNPGWLMVVFLSALLIVACTTFKEPPRQQAYLAVNSTDEESEETVQTVFKYKWWPAFKTLWLQHSIWVLFFFSWANNFILSELETALPALLRRKFSWDQLEISLMFCYLGVIVLVAFVLIHSFSAKVADRSFIGLGLLLYNAGLLLCIIFLSGEKTEAYFFFPIITLLTVSIPLFGSPNMSLYSKMIESYGGHEYTGLFIGFLQLSNSSSRLIAPIYGGYSLGFDKLLVLFMPPAALCTFSLLLLLFKWKMLVIRKEESNQDDENDE